MSSGHEKVTCAAVATWSFGALAVEECAPLLMSGMSALDAVEKGINKVTRTLVQILVAVANIQMRTS